MPLIFPEIDAMIDEFRDSYNRAEEKGRYIASSTYLDSLSIVYANLARNKRLTHHARYAKKVITEMSPSYAAGYFQSKDQDSKKRTKSS